MKLSKILSAQIVGLHTHIITIEVDIFNGFHTFSVVGLPDKAVEESRDRVNSAIKSAGFTAPKSEGQQKVIVSLAPADLKKEGPLFDLPIALGYLLASKTISFDPAKKLFVGELSLSGDLHPIKGSLLLAQKAREAGFKEIYLPQENAREAALIEGITVYGVATLEEVVDHLNTKKREGERNVRKQTLTPQPKTPFTHTQRAHTTDFSDIKGQETAKRGLEIAAAGGHNIAFYGPPGTGKTLLAKAFASILPPLTFNEALEVTGIHSIVGQLDTTLLTKTPFRAPHNTSSYISVIGGGTYPKPGEVTLAHRGVLFLDEFPEFDRRVVESLRQPLEDRRVSIARAKGSEVFPASFTLVAALNPCPCGYHGDPITTCTCPPAHLLRYQRKLSGPIVDRIDMWIEVARIDNTELSNMKPSTQRESDEVRQRVMTARKIQHSRLGEKLNSTMSVRDLKTLRLPETTKRTLDTASRKLNLSSRAYHRVIKLARTIADLDNSPEIQEKHIFEALQYRPRNLF